MSGLTSFAGIAALSVPFYSFGVDAFALIGSFGATAALVYGAPNAPLSQVRSLLRVPPCSTMCLPPVTMCLCVAVSAQPRNVVGGHVLSAAVGVATAKACAAAGAGLVVAAPLSVSASIMLMMATRTLHPSVLLPWLNTLWCGPFLSPGCFTPLRRPAAATSLIACIGGPAISALGWWYPVAPVGVGATVLVAVAVAGNNVTFKRYPNFWW